MRSRIVIGIVCSIVVVLGFSGLVAARLFVFNFSRIPQNGMYPGLPQGSLVFSWRNPYRTASEVKRGDVVLFKRIEEGTEYKFIWRVIALPGEKVEIDGESILINGQKIRRQQVRKDGEMIIYLESNGPMSYEVAYPGDGGDGEQPRISQVVPPNSFYVLGDNRFNALDSRFTGPVTFESIIGKKM